MKALLIGCGQGGSRLTEAIMKIQCATFGIGTEGRSVRKQFDALLINTNTADYKNIDKRCIPEKNRLVIGGGFIQTSGRGAGGDPRLGAQAARHDIFKIEAGIEEVLRDVNLNPEMTNIDAIIVVSALGGGSGSGMGPVIAHTIKERFGSHYPIIGLVSLPGKEEGWLNSYNASLSINTWLKENNFDGIITIALGGKSLKPTDTSLEYFARFNKSIAKALYILFGGGTMGEGSKTVDVQDILATIREGGGICTLGHMCCHISDGSQKEKSDCPFLTGESPSVKIPGSEIPMLLEKVEELCDSHLFLPIDIGTARAGLLVIKDSTKFKLTQEAGSRAANGVQAKISGPLRYSGLSHETFPLITDNSKEKVFSDAEISNDDQAFSRNQTVELALLLSGISNVRRIRDLQEAAEKILRYSRPPMGERLLSETLGIGIGDLSDERRFLPCSRSRENLEAKCQSKATAFALSKFRDEVKKINGNLLNADALTRGFGVVDVKPVPDDLIGCDTATAKKTVHTCFEIDLIFHNPLDATVFRNKTILRIKAAKETELETGKDLIIWEPEEVYESCIGWTALEQQVSDDITKELRTTVPDAVVAGIGNYPDINGMNRRYVKRARVITGAPDGKTKVCTYYYWIQAHPRPVIFNQHDLDALQRLREKPEYHNFWEILLGKNDEFPSTEKIRELFLELGITPQGDESHE
ncbi:MAG: hypothetical protein LUQ31_07810 [Methanoregula sp.]|nr:hypothetical protein [Methanoregula sp.]